MKQIFIAVAASLIMTSTASAGVLTIPNTFTAGSPAVAADVNANFAAGKTAVDDNNTRITANTASAGTNTTDIAANVSNITTLQNSKAGYATAVNNSGSPTTIIAMTTTGQAIVTLTITAPANGFAIVTGKAFSVVNHTMGTMHLVGMKISTTSGDVAAGYDLSVSQAASQQPTAGYGKMISANAVIPVVAGANIIYLNAYAPVGAGHNIQQPKLTAIYVPNAY
ncbi:hypothetical protein D8Y20_10930 [Mariprofundus sp. EBB-1]|nr:hypothetical protein D8Y20_10930 [Mariprofundus sp. EBB-1]